MLALAGACSSKVVSGETVLREVADGIDHDPIVANSEYGSMGFAATDSKGHLADLK